jgi:hypothetical protein
MGQSLEKANFSSYGISIVPNGQAVDILILFKNLEGGQKFFELVTSYSKHPSFYCIRQPDKTHIIKIEYKSDKDHQEYLSMPCSYTVQDYPPLELLKEKKSFRVIIGTEKVINGQVTNMGTNMTFAPSVVEYLDNPSDYKLSPERQN